MDLGLEHHIDNHPLFRKNADGADRQGSEFAGQLDDRRSKQDVRNDVIKGHEIMGTDWNRFAQLPKNVQARHHKEAEFLGYHANSGAR